MVQVLASVLTRDNVNECDEDGFSCLFAAISQGHLNVVDLMISLGVNLNSRWNNTSPLRHAINFGQADIALRLLKAGAQVATDGPPSLAFDAVKRCPTMFETLVLNGAKLNDVVDGKSALCFAIFLGHLSIVKFILEREPGAAKFKNVLGPNALFGVINYAASSKCVRSVVMDMLNVVLPLTDINEANEERGLTPLMIAVLGKKLDIVRVLLSRGADRNIRCKRKSTALHYAACSTVEICKELFVEPVNVNIRGVADATPLLFAADESPDVIKFLLSIGADRTLKTTGGLTALDVALKAGKEENALLLMPELAVPRPDYVDAI